MTGSGLRAGALLFAEKQDGKIDGTIYYVENATFIPQRYIR